MNIPYITHVESAHEMLDFVNKEFHSCSIKQKLEIKRSLREKVRKFSVEGALKKTLHIKEELDTSLSSENIHENDNLNGCKDVNLNNESEDLFTIKYLAQELRKMSDQQRIIANKAIREVIYHGQMEHLTTYSNFSLNGE